MTLRASMLAAVCLANAARSASSLVLSLSSLVRVSSAVFIFFFNRSVFSCHFLFLSRNSAGDPGRSGLPREPCTAVLLGKGFGVLAGMPLELLFATRQSLLTKNSSPVIDDVERLYVSAGDGIL